MILLDRQLGNHAWPSTSLPELRYATAPSSPTSRAASWAPPRQAPRAYVKWANKTLDLLEEVRRRKRTSRQIAGLEKSLAFNLSGPSSTRSSVQNLTPKGGASAVRARPVHRPGFRRVRPFPPPADGSLLHDHGLWLGSARLGAGGTASDHREVYDHQSTSTRPLCRSSSSMPGSTRTTCSKRTARPTSRGGLESLELSGRGRPIRGGRQADLAVLDTRRRKRLFSARPLSRGSGRRACRKPADDRRRGRPPRTASPTQERLSRQAAP